MLLLVRFIRIAAFFIRYGRSGSLGLIEARAFAYLNVLRMVFLKLFYSLSYSLNFLLLSDV